MKVKNLWPEKIDTTIPKQVRLSLKAWAAEYLVNSPLPYSSKTIEEWFVFEVSLYINRQGTFANPKDPGAKRVGEDLDRMSAITGISKHTQFMVAETISHALVAKGYLIPEVDKTIPSERPMTDEQVGVALVYTILDELKCIPIFHNLAESQKTNKKRERVVALEVIEALAEIYTRYTNKKPTTTEGGPFFQLVEHVLYAIGYDTANPRKLISEVLRKEHTTV